MVGWLTSIPADKSQTQASPPVWLATTLNRRNRTGSDSAFSVAANRLADSAESGSRTSGANAHPGSTASGHCDFDTHQY